MLSAPYALRTARYDVCPAYLPAPAHLNVILSLQSSRTPMTEITNEHCMAVGQPRVARELANATCRPVAPVAQLVTS